MKFKAGDRIGKIEEKFASGLVVRISDNPWNDDLDYSIKWDVVGFSIGYGPEQIDDKYEVKMDKPTSRLNRILDSIEKKQPFVSRFLRWIREPKNKTWRIFFGILLILGGIFSILPGLGIWMLPLGLIFLAIDVYMLRAPITSAIIRFQRWFANIKRKFRPQK